jgi:hypothetical protein
LRIEPVHEAPRSKVSTTDLQYGTIIVARIRAYSVKAVESKFTLKTMTNPNLYP